MSATSATTAQPMSATTATTAQPMSATSATIAQPKSATSASSAQPMSSMTSIGSSTTTTASGSPSSSAGMINAGRPTSEQAAMGGLSGVVADVMMNTGRRLLQVDVSSPSNIHQHPGCNGRNFSYSDVSGVKMLYSLIIAARKVW